MSSTSRSRNQQRDDEIRRLREAGEVSLQELADRYGITLERVRQIQVAGKNLSTAPDPLTGVSPMQAYNRELNRRFHALRVAREHEEASEYETAILMRWIGGEDVPSIAHSLGLPVVTTQAVLDEKITDEGIAARRTNMTARRFPDVSSGPREDGEARDDRHWTAERCYIALYHVAAANGGVLPSTGDYKKMSTKNPDLPSFPTVRNRIGRWSEVRVGVNTMLRQANLVA